jgi:hypothetical protein
MQIFLVPKTLSSRLSDSEKSQVEGRKEKMVFSDESWVILTFPPGFLGTLMLNLSEKDPFS